MRLPVISRNTGVGLLAAAAVAGASANWWLLSTPVNITPTVEQAGGPTSVAPVVLLSSAVSDNLPETVSRPVFSSTRRPPEPKAEAHAEETAAVAAKAPDNLELRGIMRHNPKRVAVLIRSNTNLPGSWVRVGETVEGWVVREIHDDRAIVETNGQRYELQISYRGKSSTAP